MLYLCVSVLQDGLVPQQPGPSEAPSWEASEETVERLAHLEQLVVQLKELVREKDTQLAQRDAQIQVGLRGQDSVGRDF